MALSEKNLTAENEYGYRSMIKKPKPDLTLVPLIGAPKRIGYVFKSLDPRIMKDQWTWSAHATNGKCTAFNSGFDKRANALKAIQKEVPGLTKVYYMRPPK